MSSSSATSARLDSPILYRWDLNENSTRFDYPRVQPEGDILQIQFSILAFINFLVAASSMLVIVAILKSKRIRSRTFNLYLLFMAIPDFIGSFLCLLTCALSASRSIFFSEAMCGFQSFYLVFAFCGNAWTNVVIMNEVNKLLTYSEHRRRYFPPKRQRVYCQVAVVYTYALSWAALVAYPFQGVPIISKPYYGFACFPMEQDTASSLFLYVAFLPGILIFPMLYSLFIMGRILRRGMLPKAGKRRALSIFLMRLIVVYFVGWMPFLIFCFLGNFINLGPWWFWVGAFLSHFQGFFSSVVVYNTSELIGNEMKRLLRCDCRGSWEDGRNSKGGDSTNGFTRFGSRSSKSMALVSSSLGSHSLDDLQHSGSFQLCNKSGEDVALTRTTTVPTRGSEILEDSKTFNDAKSQSFGSGSIHNSNKSDDTSKRSCVVVAIQDAFLGDESSSSDEDEDDVEGGADELLKEMNNSKEKKNDSAKQVDLDDLEKGVNENKGIEGVE